MSDESCVTIIIHPSISHHSIPYTSILHLFLTPIQSHTHTLPLPTLPSSPTYTPPYPTLTPTLPSPPPLPILPLPSPPLTRNPTPL